MKIFSCWLSGWFVSPNFIFLQPTEEKQKKKRMSVDDITRECRRTAYNREGNGKFGFSLFFSLSFFFLPTNFCFVLIFFLVISDNQTETQLEDTVIANRVHLLFIRYWERDIITCCKKSYQQ